MIARTDELPQIIDAGHSHSIYSAASVNTPLQAVSATSAQPMIGAINQLTNTPPAAFGAPFNANDIIAARASRNHDGLEQRQRAQAAALRQQLLAEEQAMANSALRFVQIFIADPDTMVPLKDRLLHHTDQFLTDLTDQELFYELPMATILEAHNAKRAKLYNKNVKDRTETLEPVRIRDLKMTVVTIASF